MEAKVKEIIMGAMQVFLRLGFKNVSMDDLAKELRVSKKTLYKYFSDKNDLINQVIDTSLLIDQELIEQDIQKAENALEELFAITKHVSIRMKQAMPSVFFELQKFYPEAWNKFMQFKQAFITSCISNNLQRGQQEGWYREDIAAEVITHFFVKILDSVIEQSNNPVHHMNFVELHRTAVLYHLRSICNEKGMSYILKKLTN